MSAASGTIVDLPKHEIIGLQAAPAIVVLGGISADRHICAGTSDSTPGWWDSIAGVGRPLDSTQYRLIGFDYLDGGTRRDGRPERVVTTYDQADALAAVLDEIDVGCVRTVVGASYGGMVALAFAERYPERLQRLVVISAAHKAHPMTTALRSIQRRIVELALETGRPREGLVLARALATTTYRSAKEFATRFDAAPTSRDDNDATFPVESYLRHQGERFAARWTPARFLALSLSNDLHEVDPARIRTPAFLIAAENDAVVPREQVDELAREFGAPCEVVDLPSIHGHDAFLTEPGTLGRILVNALTSSGLS
jgi:homoserine O-acetyltransferase